MRALLERRWLVEVALGVALGWATVSFLSTTAFSIVNAVRTEVSLPAGAPDDLLVVSVDGHALDLSGPVATGTVLLALVGLAAWLVRRLPPP